MGKKKGSRSGADGSGGDGKQQPAPAGGKGDGDSKKKDIQPKQKQDEKQPQPGPSGDAGSALQPQGPGQKGKTPQQSKKDGVQQGKQQQGQYQPQKDQQKQQHPQQGQQKQQQPQGQQKQHPQQGQQKQHPHQVQQKQQTEQGQQQGWAKGQQRQQPPQDKQPQQGQQKGWGQQRQPPQQGQQRGWGQSQQAQPGYQQSPQWQQPPQGQQQGWGPTQGQQRQQPQQWQQPPPGQQQGWGPTQGQQRQQPQQWQQPPQGQGVRPKGQQLPQQMQPQLPQAASSTTSQDSIASIKRDIDTLSIASTSSSKSTTQRGPPSAPAQSSKGVASQYNIRSSPPDPKVAQWRGSVGTHHTIETNYVTLNLDKMPSTAYQYDVQFSLERPTRFRTPAFEQFRCTILSRHRKSFPIAFDGKNIAYSAERIPSQGLGEFPIIFIDQDTNVQKEIKITIKEAVDIEVDLAALKSYRHSGITEKPMRALQCLDVVLRTAPQDKSKLAGRAFYVPPKKPEDLEDGFELWRGLYQSLVLGDVPMMNIDVAHKGFPRSESLVEVIDKRGNGADEYIKNLKIIYEPPRVMNGKSKLFMANGLGDAANRQKFKDESGREMTIQQYFASKNVNLARPTYPCISVGTVRKIYLPAELCKIQAGQDVRKRAGPNQIRNLIKFAATPTSIRKQKIMDIFRYFNYNQCEIVKGFNLQLSPEFIQIRARNIAPPLLRYMDGTVRPEKGSWRADTKKYLESAPMAKWGILVTASRINDVALGKFAQMIISQAQKNKMNIDPNYKKLTETNVRNLLAKFDEFKRENCSIVFVIITGFGNIYAQVKQKAELNYGILTQCVKVTTVERRMDLSTISNIFLKVNSKLNGTNHKIEPSSEIAIMSNQQATVMFIGADVTHPSPDQSYIPSVVGVVGSYDQFGFRYRVCWRLQGAKVEMIADMQNITRELLTYFKEKRGKLPTHIIYYRDGVSDGQFAQLKSIELNAMNKACASMQSNYRPKITCLVVQKRHHTRFFPIDKKIVHPRDRFENVLPGTVVDTNIIHPGEKQFFLVSHESIQGTAKPAKYCIIRDDAEFGADELQALTYSMCHMFTRCNRSVSYPAPAYYAHLVAARGRVYIDGVRINTEQLEKEYRSRNFERINTSNPMFFV